MLSDNLIKSIMAEKRHVAARLLEVQRALHLTKAECQTESGNHQPGKDISQILMGIAGHMEHERLLPDEMVQSEENSHHAEMGAGSLEPSHLLAQKRRLYERIARGNALAEIENRDRNLWEEKF